MSVRPVWAEISRSKLLHNFRLLRSLAAPAEAMAVVKADAYGHGTVACSQLLSADGAKWLGVTNVEEAVRVRAACPDAEILSMTGLLPGETEAVFEHRITPVVWDAEHLEDAARIGKSLPVHLKIDTGMSRQGVRVQELPALLDRLRAFPSLRLDGVMTHFHSPEALNNTSNSEQFAEFVTAVDTIYRRGFQAQWIHAGNSTSIFSPGPSELAGLAKRHDAKAMMRPGLSLYGYAARFTGGKTPAAAAELKPVLAWKTRVNSLRTIEAGDVAGYNATFRAARTTKLALLPVGYADGLNRLLSNRGSVLVRGQRAPIVGRVSMDLTTVDVTDILSVAAGDEVVLIGSQGAEMITAYDHADIAGTIPYEVLCNIGARVPRVIVD